MQKISQILRRRNQRYMLDLRLAAMLAACLVGCSEQTQEFKAVSDGKSFIEAKKMAENGDAVAQYEIGSALFEGRGVPKDEKEGVKWFRRAAHQENEKAIAALGFAYIIGRGVTKDECEAFKYIRKAAEMGDTIAQFNLGSFYHEGYCIPKNAMEGVRWFQKAANMGYAPAEYKIGRAYFIGEGVPKNHVEAYKWFLLSGAQGNQDAKVAIDVIEKELSPAQREEGQRLAGERFTLNSR